MYRNPYVVNPYLYNPYYNPYIKTARFNLKSLLQLPETTKNVLRILVPGALGIGATATTLGALQAQRQAFENMLANANPIRVTPPSSGGLLGDLSPVVNALASTPTLAGAALGGVGGFLTGGTDKENRKVAIRNALIGMLLGAGAGAGLRYFNVV